jgi:energy-coupling factor transport system permease protein
MKFIYQYSAGESFLHRLDARTKLLFVAVFLFLTWFMPWPWPVVLAVAVVGLLAALGKTYPWNYSPFLMYLLPIMIAISAIHALTGPPPRTSWVIQLSISGLFNGLTIAFRLASMGIAFIAFSLTTDPFDWGLSLYQAGLPYKPAFMFAFAMRFFPLLQEELATIRNALRARGYHAVDTRNPVSLVQGVAVSMFPLALGALRRSQDIAMSMELRGFSFPEATGVKRVIFRDIGIRTRDKVCMAITLLLFVLAVYYLIKAGYMGAVGLRGYF